LVQRQFVATQPNQLWIADITYVPTRYEDFLYLAVVLDVFSRRVVGWAMAAHLRTELVVGALEMAVWRWRSGIANPAKASFTILSMAASTPHCSLANTARRWASRVPWGQWAIATITPWPKASSPR
jgi:transposase InsO family protein